MSCNWCANKSFMVLMSLVNSPMIAIPFVLGLSSDLPSLVHPMPGCRYWLTGRMRRLFLGTVKPSMERIGADLHDQLQGHASKERQDSYPKHRPLCYGA